MTIREFGIFGLAATILFVFSLVVFAELSPGYTHATKAVSELGAIGAPHQLAWNIFGFLLPGLMMAAHGWGIGVSVMIASPACCSAYRACRLRSHPFRPT